jgi:hypothetical protein
VTLMHNNSRFLDFEISIELSSVSSFGIQHHSLRRVPPASDSTFSAHTVSAPNPSAGVAFPRLRSPPVGIWMANSTERRRLQPTHSQNLIELLIDFMLLAHPRWTSWVSVVIAVQVVQVPEIIPNWRCQDRLHTR